MNNLFIYIYFVQYKEFTENYFFYLLENLPYPSGIKILKYIPVLFFSRFCGREIQLWIDDGKSFSFFREHEDLLAGTQWKQVTAEQTASTDVPQRVGSVEAECCEKQC
jgi:hypothetical protein